MQNFFINWKKVAAIFQPVYELRVYMRTNDKWMKNWQVLKQSNVDNVSTKLMLFFLSFSFFFSSRNSRIKLSSLHYSRKKSVLLCRHNPTDNWSELHSSHMCWSWVKSLAAFNQLIIITFNELFGRYFLLPL